MKANFWIEIGSNSMPICVEKCTFMPTIHHSQSSNWHHFGTVGELVQCKIQRDDARHMVKNLLEKCAHILPYHELMKMEAATKMWGEGKVEE
jgi:hypothetical protein